jgi:hypothetical protein
MEFWNDGKMGNEVMIIFGLLQCIDEIMECRIESLDILYCDNTYILVIYYLIYL